MGLKNFQMFAMELIFPENSAFTSKTVRVHTSLCFLNFHQQQFQLCSFTFGTQQQGLPLLITQRQAPPSRWVSTMCLKFKNSVPVGGNLTKNPLDLAGTNYFHKMPARWIKDAWERLWSSTKIRAQTKFQEKKDSIVSKFWKYEKSKIRCPKNLGVYRINLQLC